MTLAHVWFCLQFLVHLQKGQCESEPHQPNNKNIYIYLSGPKQMKYQTFLMWIHPKNELIDTTMNRQLISVLWCSYTELMQADNPEATSLSGKTCSFLQEHHATSCWPVKIDSRNKINKDTRENECWHRPPTSYFLTLVWTQSKSKSSLFFFISFVFFRDRWLIGSFRDLRLHFVFKPTCFCLGFITFHQVHCGKQWLGNIKHL